MLRTCFRAVSASKFTSDSCNTCRAKMEHEVLRSPNVKPCATKSVRVSKNHASIGVATPDTAKCFSMSPKNAASIAYALSEAASNKRAFNSSLSTVLSFVNHEYAPKLDHFVPLQATLFVVKQLQDIWNQKSFLLYHVCHM